ncbi:FAD-binding oxidoreductase [Streptosporangium sp. NPDC020145]|uniref:FAD-binding oxidoreductase n=1 Tax=Streptosporangium sp. NPDC020145 TaxID=3154694 RepID=UPI00343C94E4
MTAPFEALRGTGVTVRPAEPGDAVAGVMPRWVALPRTTAEVSALMRVSAGHDLAVVPAGDGTKLAWGNPPERCDLLLRTGRLTLDGETTVEHSPGDLVVRVCAGLPLGALASFPGIAQELALDNPLGAGTVGGTLATGVAGPRRFRYGTARDLLIGVTVVLADGTAATSGGRVVKNVAGYDLGKLLCGSYGTLGVVTEAVFRLHPSPPERRWITVGLGREPDPFTALDGLVADLTASQAEPCAVEVDWPGDGDGPLVTALVEGTAAGERATAVRELARGRPAWTGNGAPGWWNTLPGDPGGALCELRLPPAEVGRALRAVTACEPSVRIRGSAASGVLWAAPPPEALPAFVPAVRDRLGVLGGHLVVLAAPYGRDEGIDRWGPSGALPLMRRVKERFDPDRRMSPGRFVGGI